MATIILTAAVSAGAFGQLTGWSLFAAEVAAAVVGSFIDSRLFASNSNVAQTGPRISQLQTTVATEGVAINKIYGRARCGGNVIWASRFEEQVVTTTSTSGGGGKGGGLGGGGGSVTQTTTTYNYFLSFAVAFCEGNERTQLGRVWADGKLLDLSAITTRFYPGSKTQSPDSYIQSIEGSANVPAFRNVAYLVFEQLLIQDFGNRMPQITAEIIKPIISTDPNKLENAVKAINLIPSAGEFVYGTQPYVVDDGHGNSKSENVHREKNRADLLVALDNLQAELPNVTHVNLVVAWFGSDLRAGNSTIRPKVEVSAKSVFPSDWLVNGINRAGAPQVTQDGMGRPIFGGTPSDDTIVQALTEIKSRGMTVSFYPFILMDIPSGNGLTDPYGGSEQAHYPWRGLITISPAIGQGSTPDKTATAGTQITSFFGSVTTGNFSISGTTVNYTGSSSDWGYRRMVLHYANLVKAAGIAGSFTVDYFYIGTELRGITTPRSSASVFPGVDKLVTLAGDVSTVFGAMTTKVSYAADWSEYHSYRPADGSNDVYFNMDSLWSNSNIDYVAIDNYIPISDWRDGTNHLDYDAVNGPTKIYDKTYLTSQIEGGEYYDYFYANQAARNSQTRTAITDVTYSKPWVFRQKDIRNWWTNTHKNRPAGVESGSTTGWAAQSKPIFFSEFGCPAVDKGTNEPNVFVDPKSSESAVPFYSNGRRDDLIQRTYYEVMVPYWRDNSPTSGVYSDLMIKPDNMYAWTWDARPYPVFPLRTDVWSDGTNYAFGHWLNGRVGASTLSELVKEICGFVGFTDADINVDDLTGNNAIVQGYTISSLMSPRDMLTPLMQAFLFDGFESGGLLTFKLRTDTVFDAYDNSGFVSDDTQNPGGYNITRAKETDLPRASQVTFIDEANFYQPGSATGMRQVGSSENIVNVQFPIVMTQSYARALADIIIQENCQGRETIAINLPLNASKYDPGDGLDLTINNREMFMKITKITRGTYLKVEAAAVEPSIYDALDFSGRGGTTQDISVFGRSVVDFVDMPLVTGQEDRPWAPRMVGYNNPMPSGINVYQKQSDGSFLLLSQITKPAVLGYLGSDLFAGPHARWDYGNTIIVTLNNFKDQLTSSAENQVLAGLNAIAVQTPTGEWEIIQFVNATLVTTGTYSLTKLLRGQLGTETVIGNPSTAGSSVVLLDVATLFTLQLPNPQARLTFDYLYGPADLDMSSVFYQTVTKTFTAAGLLPYAPCGLRARRSGTSGDVLIQWTRRTRFGGDDFDAPDVPLNEQYEQYDLEIYSDSTYTTLLRTIPALTTTDYTYLVADQTTDFGSLQTNIYIIVYQLSAAVGRGRPGKGLVYTGGNNG